MGIVDDTEKQVTPENRATFRFLATVTGIVFACASGALWGTAQLKAYIITTSRDANALGAQASMQTHAEHERAINELRVDVRDLKARAERCSDRITEVTSDLRAYRAERSGRSNP